MTQSRPSRPAIARRRGAATIEFVLVFPIVLFLTLTLVQVMLLMVGRSFVHYSAYAATRAAVSQVPLDLSDTGGEMSNVVVISDASPKYTAIRRAAAAALIAVSGPMADGSSNEADRVVEALRTYLQQSGRGEPNWVGRLLPERATYAVERTRVRVLRVTQPLNAAGEPTDDVRFDAVPAGDVAHFGPLDPIGVEVAHDLYLSVPYVWRMFASGEADAAVGGGYTTVRARYVLTNDGINRTLPPEPPLPREDRN